MTPAFALIALASAVYLTKNDPEGCMIFGDDLSLCGYKVTSFIDLSHAKYDLILNCVFIVEVLSIAMTSVAFVAVWSYMGVFNWYHSLQQMLQERS